MHLSDTSQRLTIIYTILKNPCEKASSSENFACFRWRCFSLKTGENSNLLLNVRLKHWIHSWALVSDVKELWLAVIISWQFLVWAERGGTSFILPVATVRGSALGTRHSLCCTPPNASPPVGSGPSGYLRLSLYLDLEGQEQWWCWQVIAWRHPGGYRQSHISWHFS